MTQSSEVSRALAKFDAGKSTLLNGSVQVYLLSLQLAETIRSALVNAERVQGLVEALEKLSSEITFERSENNFGQGNWIVNQAGYAAFQNLFQALAAFNAGRDEGEK